MGLQSFLDTTTINSSINIGDLLITIAISFILGLLISITYMKTTKGTKQSLMLSLTFLPITISLIIMIIGSNIASALSLGGAFAIIRFRSDPGDPKDISFILFTMASGLACGMGLYLYSVIFTVLLCLIMFLLFFTGFGLSETMPMLLKITIPEDLDYQGVFDDILTKSSDSYILTKVRTTDLGSLFELSYKLTLKNGVNQKKFIDELRCRNGNLNIILSLVPEFKEI